MSPTPADMEMWGSNFIYNDREIDDMMVFMASGENNPEGACLMATLLQEELPLTSATMAAPAAAPGPAPPSRPSPTSSQDSATVTLALAAAPPPPTALLAAAGTGEQQDDARSALANAGSDAATHLPSSDASLAALRSAAGTPCAAPPSHAAPKPPTGLVLPAPPAPHLMGLPYDAYAGWPGMATANGTDSDDGRGGGSAQRGGGGGVSHSTIEKQRRDRLNSLIEVLGDLVPPSEGKYAKAGCTLRRPKHIILGDAINTIKCLREHIQMMAEHNQLAYAAAANATPASAGDAAGAATPAAAQYAAYLSAVTTAAPSTSAAVHSRKRSRCKAEAR